MDAIRDVDRGREGEVRLSVEVAVAARRRSSDPVSHSTESGSGVEGCGGRTNSLSLAIAEAPTLPH